jgi:hypothetical protein
MSARQDDEPRAPGRPALPADEKAVVGSIRLTSARWGKLRRLGMAWLGKAIDRAREPGDKK